MSARPRMQEAGSVREEPYGEGLAGLNVGPGS
ncbi:uncharacterized protein G2W53_007046 [Senna tora]|uniref:Uncharacterized protein n=1 Tax=Senna tora TaxID=362788 RepID=A0A834X6B6_9FABA|nr:uncharacterized protein G2W53_007046 [Senna tora]